MVCSSPKNPGTWRSGVSLRSGNSGNSGHSDLLCELATKIRGRFRVVRVHPRETVASTRPVMDLGNAF